MWTPSVAVAAAMLALVAFAALRRMSAPAWPAALAAALVPAGYLTFSFIVQGSAKEVVTAVAVYGGIPGGMTPEADELVQLVMGQMMDQQQSLPAPP